MRAKEAAARARNERWWRRRRRRRRGRWRRRRRLRHRRRRRRLRRLRGRRLGIATCVATSGKLSLPPLQWSGPEPRVAGPAWPGACLADFSTKLEPFFARPHAELQQRREAPCPPQAPQIFITIRRALVGDDPQAATGTYVRRLGPHGELPATSCYNPYPRYPRPVIR